MRQVNGLVIETIVRFTNRLHQYPWVVLLVFALVTLLALSSVSRLQINATPYMIGYQHPSRVADHRVKSLFNNTGEQAYIAVVRQSGDVFNRVSLQLVHDLTRALEKLNLISAQDEQRLSAMALELEGSPQGDLFKSLLQDGLDVTDYYPLEKGLLSLKKEQSVSAESVAWLENLLIRLKPVRKVRSIVTLENITPIEDGIDIHPLMAYVPMDEQQIRALKDEIFANPVYLNSLIAHDGSATSIQVEFSIAEDDSPTMLLAYQAIMAAIDRTHSGPHSVHLSGPPMIAAQTAVSIEQDNQILLPGVLVVILGVLLLGFGTIQGMVIPLIIAMLSVLWTLGIMAASGVKQNIITSVLPVFIIAIAVCDAIHFLADYYRHLPENATRQQRSLTTALAVRQLFWPMFLTTLTTAVGFFSLTGTQVRFISEFGVFVGIGVIIAWLITIFFLPTVLVLWKGKSPKKGLLVYTRFDQHLQRLGRVADYAKWVVCLMGGVLLVGGWVIAQGLRVDNQVIGYFDDNSRIRVDDAQINEKFGGTNPISIWVQANHVDAYKEAAYLVALDKIEARLKEHQAVGYVYGLPDFIKRLHQTLNNDLSKEGFRLPEKMSSALLAQYYLLYENGNGRDLFNVVDRRYQNSRIVAVLHSDRSSEVAAIMDDVLHYASTVLPEGAIMTIAGYGEILVATTNAVVWGQVTSLLLAAVLITLVVMIVFRSLIIGLLVPLPLILTLVGVFSVMALSGTDLDVGTSIIAAISFGIGIDYSIHILSALQTSVCQTRESRIHEALQRCGKPILINTLALGFGFLVLALSDYQALVNLGCFIALTMILGALFSLLILPAVAESVLLRRSMVKASLSPIAEEYANVSRVGETQKPTTENGQRLRVLSERELE